MHRFSGGVVMGQALRRFATAGLVLGLVMFSAGPVRADVTIAPERATQGEPAVQLAFLVSNVEPVSTTRFQLILPSRPPLATVFAQSLPGWTTAIRTRHLAHPIPTDAGGTSDVVAEIAWTATSADRAIKTGAFQSFEVQIGPLPYTTQIVFNALQTFANGDVLRWNETTTRDNPEPGVPAPVLRLTPPTPPLAPGALTKAEGAAITNLESRVDAARTIGVVGILVGTLALIVAGIAVASRRRRAPG
jgi:periplasmic copper chaperone A